MPDTWSFSPAPPRGRTYVALWWRWGATPKVVALGTVPARDRASARAVAACCWPGVGAELRVRAPSAVRRRVLLDALAADGAADRLPGH